MAVTLSSDLVLDVMRNADPVRARRAAAKLDPAETGGLGDVSEFHRTLGGLVTARIGTPVLPGGRIEVPVLGMSAFHESSELAENHAQDGTNVKQQEKASAYVSFEQMFLSNMFEAILPSAESGLFGDKISGGIWRSMAADQLSGVYAKSGGVGLAQSLLPPTSINRASADQWPYFELAEIRSFVQELVGA